MNEEILAFYSFTIFKCLHLGKNETIFYSRSILQIRFAAAGVIVSQNSHTDDRNFCTTVATISSLMFYNLLEHVNNVVQDYFPKTMLNQFETFYK